MDKQLATAVRSSNLLAIAKQYERAGDREGMFKACAEYIAGIDQDYPAVRYTPESLFVVLESRGALIRINGYLWDIDAPGWCSATYAPGWCSDTWRLVRSTMPDILLESYSLPDLLQMMADNPQVFV